MPACLLFLSPSTFYFLSSLPDASSEPRRLCDNRINQPGAMCLHNTPFLHQLEFGFAASLNFLSAFPPDPEAQRSRSIPMTPGA